MRSSQSKSGSRGGQTGLKASPWASYQGYFPFASAEGTDRSGSGPLPGSDAARLAIAIASTVRAVAVTIAGSPPGNGRPRGGGARPPTLPGESAGRYSSRTAPPRRTRSRARCPDAPGLRAGRTTRARPRSARCWSGPGPAGHSPPRSRARTIPRTRAGPATGRRAHPRGARRAPRSGEPPTTTSPAPAG